MPSHLSHDPFNSNFKRSGAATIGRSKQDFVVFVRHACEKASKLNTAIAATVHADEASKNAAITASHADVQTPYPRMHDIFVEQQSAVTPASVCQ